MSLLTNRLRLLGRMNWWLTAAVLLLLGIGVAFIYSAGFVSDEQRMSGPFRKQIQWAFVGILCYGGIAMFDYRRLRSISWWAYAGTLALLLLVLIVGEKRFGARRWLDLAFLSVQPSEFAKLSTIMVLAGLLSRPGQSLRGFLPVLSLLVMAGIPMFLIYKEPDLGTAMIFVPMIAAMMFAGGISMRAILTLAGIGLSIAAFVGACLFLPEKMGASPETCERVAKLSLLSDYQRDRIMVYFKHDKDPLGAGWNKMQSEISVGSGGVWGKGFLKGTQNILGFLPRSVSPTDFIYAVIAEEKGFAGSVVVLMLFGIVILCGTQAAMLSDDKMGRVLCMGIVGMIFCHVFINIAMTVGIMPITGVPLPLLSYGGSFMVVMMSALGIIQSVYIRSQRAPMLP